LSQARIAAEGGEPGKAEAMEIAHFRNELIACISKGSNALVRLTIQHIDTSARHARGRPKRRRAVNGPMDNMATMVYIAWIYNQ